MLRASTGYSIWLRRCACARRFFFAAPAMLLLALCAAPAQATVYNVNSGADDGSPGTLRWAITQANSDSSGDHSINISLPSDTTIVLASELPTLNNSAAAITIDASSSTRLTVSGGGTNRVF